MPYLIASKTKNEIWIHKILLLFKVLVRLRNLLKKKRLILSQSIKVLFRLKEI